MRFACRPNQADPASARERAHDLVADVLITRPWVRDFASAPRMAATSRRASRSPRVSNSLVLH